MHTALSNLPCLIVRNALADICFRICNALADVCLAVRNTLTSDPQIYRAIRIVFSAVSTPSWLNEPMTMSAESWTSERAFATV